MRHPICSECNKPMVPTFVFAYNEYACLPCNTKDEFFPRGFGRELTAGERGGVTRRKNLWGDELHRIGTTIGVVEDALLKWKESPVKSATTRTLCSNTGRRTYRENLMAKPIEIRTDMDAHVAQFTYNMVAGCCEEHMDLEYPVAQMQELSAQLKKWREEKPYWVYDPDKVFASRTYAWGLYTKKPKTPHHKRGPALRRKARKGLIFKPKGIRPIDPETGDRMGFRGDALVEMRGRDNLYIRTAQGQLIKMHP